MDGDILGKAGGDAIFGVRIGVNTRFKISLIIKGDRHLRNQEIVVYHYKIIKAYPESDERPRLVHFDAKHSYLLCLLRRADGRYEPTSGQIDPVDSVWELKRLVLDREPD